MEVVAEEDYDCKHGELIVEVTDPNPAITEDTENAIIGPTFVKPLQKVTFKYKKFTPGAAWNITLPAEKNKEVDDVIDYVLTNNDLTVTWTQMTSGSYILHYGNLEHTVIVESLF